MNSSTSDYNNKGNMELEEKAHSKSTLKKFIYCILYYADSFFNSITQKKNNKIFIRFRRSQSHMIT